MEIEIPTNKMTKKEVLNLLIWAVLLIISIVSPILFFKNYKDTQLAKQAVSVAEQEYVQSMRELITDREVTFVVRPNSEESDLGGKEELYVTLRNPGSNVEHIVKLRTHVTVEDSVDGLWHITVSSDDSDNSIIVYTPADYIKYTSK